VAGFDFAHPWLVLIRPVTRFSYHTPEKAHVYLVGEEESENLKVD
jgi:hypothetical protein